MEYTKELKSFGFLPRPTQYPAQRGWLSSGLISEDFAEALVSAFRARGWEANACQEDDSDNSIVWVKP